MADPTPAPAPTDPARQYLPYICSTASSTASTCTLPFHTHLLTFRLRGAMIAT